MEELIARHVSGRLKVAPEHTEDNVLKMMRKPSFELFRAIQKDIRPCKQTTRIEPAINPLFHIQPSRLYRGGYGKLGYPDQEAAFPTRTGTGFYTYPMTLATEMYYTGYHPYTLEKVYTAHTKEQKLAQRQFFFWYKPEFRRQITQALQRIGKKDLIGKLFGR